MIYNFHRQVCVRYPQDKVYHVVTPQRKHLVKAVARKSKKAVATEALKDPITKSYIVSILGIELAKEIRAMSSDSVKSVLQSSDPDDLKEFKWETLHSELSLHAPVMSKLLQLATKTRRPRMNQEAVIGACAAIVINHRNPKMNLVQKLTSLILYAGHASKQVLHIITLLLVLI